MAAATSWRQIRRVRDVAQFEAQTGGVPPVPNVPDSYAARVVKLIPAEVISLYVTLDALVRAYLARSSTPGGGVAAHGDLLRWIAFVAGLLGTPYYLYVITKVRSAPQVVIATVAFAIWVMALGGPFPASWGLAGAIALVLFTFLVPETQK